MNLKINELRKLKRELEEQKEINKLKSEIQSLQEPNTISKYGTQVIHGLEKVGKGFKKGLTNIKKNINAKNKMEN